jgi:hypothetical protein
MNVERIQAAQEEIRKYLPDRPEYIVDTSEFENVKARLASLENGHHIGGAKPEPGRPVLLKRTSSGSSSDPGSSTQSTQDDGRPTLKRASGSIDSAQSTQDQKDDAGPTLKQAPATTASAGTDSSSSTQTMQDQKDNGLPTLKQAPGSTDSGSAGSAGSTQATQDQKGDSPPTLKQAQATPNFQN